MQKHSKNSTINSYIRNRNTAILILLIVVAVSFLFFRNSMKPAVYVEFRSDSLYLNCYDKDELSIPYEDIISLELSGSFEPGVMLEGTDNSRIRSGLWNNTLLGEYHSYIQKSIGKCIILTTHDSTAVFNYESEDVTESIYTALMETQN